MIDMLGRENDPAIEFDGIYDLNRCIAALLASEQTREIVRLEP